MNPIIILWAHPRSMSTAIERVMRERGDFDCLHEPFLHYYYLERNDKVLPYFENSENHPTGYAGIRDMILRRARHAPVFAKDMSYYVMPELLDDVEFCRRVRHCFLIRDPWRAIMSYYKLDNTLSLAEIGLEAQWRHFEGLRALGIEDCPVLEAESVQADSASAMGGFWRALGLDYRDQALAWKSESTPRDWQYVHGWHRNVSDSSGIRTISKAENVAARAEFDDLCRVEPGLRQMLDHHLPFYQQLKSHSLSGG